MSLSRSFDVYIEIFTRLSPHQQSQQSMPEHESQCTPLVAKPDQTNVEHYTTQGLIVFTPGGPVYMHGVCILRDSSPSSAGQAASRIQQDVPLKLGTNVNGALNAMKKQGDSMENVIIMTPDGCGYHGGVQIPRNQLTIVDGKPNLLFDQMTVRTKPSFAHMTMRELAEWRLGVLIQAPETATKFNRVFNMKRDEEGYSHRTYPVPFTSDMSNELEEKILSSEYDNNFIQRCLRLAEEAANRGQASLAPTLSELHGFYLRDTTSSLTSSDMAAKVATHRKKIARLTTGCLENIHSDRNTPVTKPLGSLTQIPESSRKRQAHPTPTRGLQKRQRTDDEPKLSGTL